MIQNKGDSPLYLFPDFPLPWHSGGELGWGFEILTMFTETKTPTLTFPRSTRGGENVWTLRDFSYGAD